MREAMGGKATGSRTTGGDDTGLSDGRTEAKRTQGGIEYHESSGNVFADLGVDESEECLMKSELAARIQMIVQARGLTQKEAAQVVKVPQPKLSGLFNGKFEGFSADRLFAMLNRLGCDIEVRVAQPKEGQAGRMQVM